MYKQRAKRLTTKVSVHSPSDLFKLVFQLFFYSATNAKKMVKLLSSFPAVSVPVPEVPELPDVPELSSSFSSDFHQFPVPIPAVSFPIPGIPFPFSGFPVPFPAVPIAIPPIHIAFSVPIPNPFHCIFCTHWNWKTVSFSSFPRCLVWWGVRWWLIILMDN